MRLNNLSKVTQRASGRAGSHAQACGTSKPMAVTPLPLAPPCCGLTALLSPQGEGLLQAGLRCHNPSSTRCPFVLRHLFIISRSGALALPPASP